MKKFSKKLKEQWEEFVSRQEEIKGLKQERDFYKKSTEDWIEKYSHLLTSNLALFNFQNFIAKNSDHSSGKR